MAHILVIDVGSSSVRASLFDEGARQLADTAEPHCFMTSADGASEADARLLRAAVERCVDRILTTALPIECVAMATFVGNLLGVDAANQPITPIYTYADARPAVDVEALRAQVDVPHLYEATGCPLHSAYHPARLRWYQRTGRPAPALWLDFATYLYRAWFGRDVPASSSVASWSGLLARSSGQWSTEWLQILGLSPQLLPLVGDYRVAQIGLDRAYAERWPALREAPFFLALGDGAAAHIGSGAVAPTETSLTVGTTAALRQLRDFEDPPRAPPNGLWAYRIDARREILGGATSEGGNVYAWAQENLGLEKERLIFREPFAHGLTVLPMFAGERSPGFQPDATGTLHGLRLSTSSADIAQALLESIAVRLARILDLLGGSDSLYGGGGALHASPEWAQMIADATQTPVHLIGEGTTARGAAMLALEALGKASLKELSPSAMRIFEPRPHYAEAYRAAKERQGDLYRRLYG